MFGNLNATVCTLLVIFGPISLYIAYQIDKREEAERKETEPQDTVEEEGEE